MGSIGRYIFRTTLGAFLVVLMSVTALMWITQALRDVDLMTNQGQSILVFIGITGLIVPLLVMIIAPVALMIAISYVLNKLSNDSELIVMNAAGMRPWFIFRPFLAVAIMVSIGIGFIGTYLSPKCLRELRRWATEIHTDLMSNIVQPGRFLALEAGKLTVHIRERQPNGHMQGIFLDDQREPKERVTFLAEDGDILKNERGTFLVLENGSVQRHEVGQPNPAIVLFDRYGFDLSRLTAGSTNIKYTVRERFLWELLYPPAGDALFAEQPREFRAEIHDRLTAPLYPLAFVVLVFAYLGAPRTTRQSRAMSLVGAITAICLVRGAGFIGTILGSRSPEALLVPYAALALSLGLGAWGISRGLIIEPPAFISDTVSALVERFTPRDPATTEAAS